MDEGVRAAGEEELRAGCRCNVRDVSDYRAVDDNRIKHLEMIQAVVARLGNDSFVVKGWAITVAGAFFGIALSKNDARVAFAGIIPTFGFYALDVYFLQAERLFRVLFDQVRLEDPHVEPFFMGATSATFRKRMTTEGKDVSWQATTWRPTLLGFYAAVALAAVVIGVVLSTA